MLCALEFLGSASSENAVIPCSAMALNWDRLKGSNNPINTVPDFMALISLGAGDRTLRIKSVLNTSFAETISAPAAR